MYSNKARLYQRFFVEFLGWEKILTKFFQEYPGLHSEMKIFDAGCGTGSVTKALYRHAFRQGLKNISYHAFDLNREMLDIFRQWLESENIKEKQVKFDRSC